MHETKPHLLSWWWWRNEKLKLMVVRWNCPLHTAEHETAGALFHRCCCHLMLYWLQYCWTEFTNIVFTPTSVSSKRSSNVRTTQGPFVLQACELACHLRSKRCRAGRTMLSPVNCDQRDPQDSRAKQIFDMLLNLETACNGKILNIKCTTAVRWVRLKV
jgi:hypothetical protein